jgi:hypothetical protein
MTKEFFDSLPTRSVLFELYKITPDKLKQAFEDGFVALAHACESLLGFCLSAANSNCFGKSERGGLRSSAGRFHQRQSVNNRDK